MLEDGAFAVELLIVESGIPPEFRVYAYDNGEPVATNQFSASDIRIYHYIIWGVCGIGC